MLAPDQVELIHRVIHGEDTPKERIAFLSLVDQNPEARTLAEGLLEVALLLDGVRDQDPPIRLREKILDALPARAPAPASLLMVARSFVPRWMSTFSFPPLR